MNKQISQLRLLLVVTATMFCNQVIAESIETSLSGSYRLRYETLKNPIFPTTEEVRTQTNERLSSRLLVKGQVSYGQWDGWCNCKTPVPR